MKKTLLQLALIFAGLLATRPAAQGQDIKIGVEHEHGYFGMKPVPVALSGFRGQGLEVLKFDLYVQGFTFVSPDAAQYLISGSDAGDVSGTVTDKVSQHVILSQSYNGASQRREAHAFADAVVQAITGKPGIAELRGGVAKIAFKAQLPGGNGEIYVADFDGSNPVAITQDRTIVAKPEWLPGRLALYYTSYKRGNPDIYFHNLTSGQWRRVSGNIACLNTSAAASPDGSRLAMVRSRAGSPNLWVGGADGAGLKQITQGLEDSSPCWSPDGQWICYATKVHERRRLARIPAGGGTPGYISTAGAPNPSEPAWSPDGKWIAFTSQSGAGFSICVVAADGSVPAQTLVPGENPSWAPNSRTLIYNHGPDGRQTLSVLDVFTKQYKDCHRASGSCSQPAWAK